MSSTDITLTQTCGACPEQYDAYLGGEQVGYLRLRHGHFTVRLNNSDGPLVYECTPMGDGLFEEHERDRYLNEAKVALWYALEGIPNLFPKESPTMPETPELQPINGGYHIKTLSGGRCIDVRRQLYNWRIVIGPANHDPHEGYLHGWCYFGHGVDEQGRDRTMATAFSAAMTAALIWNGEGEPPGHDKEAF